MDNEKILDDIPEKTEDNDFKPVIDIEYIIKIAKTKYAKCRMILIPKKFEKNIPKRYRDGTNINTEEEPIIMYSNYPEPIICFYDKLNKVKIVYEIDRKIYHTDLIL